MGRKLHLLRSVNEISPRLFCKKGGIVRMRTSLVTDGMYLLAGSGIEPTRSHYKEDKYHEYCSK